MGKNNKKSKAGAGKSAEKEKLTSDATDPLVSKDGDNNVDEESIPSETKIPEEEFSEIEVSSKGGSTEEERTKNNHADDSTTSPIVSSLPGGSVEITSNEVGKKEEAIVPVAQVDEPASPFQAPETVNDVNENHPLMDQSETNKKVKDAVPEQKVSEQKVTEQKVTGDDETSKLNDDVAEVASSSVDAEPLLAEEEKEPKLKQEEASFFTCLSNFKFW